MTATAQDLRRDLNAPSRPLSQTAPAAETKGAPAAEAGAAQQATPTFPRGWFDSRFDSLLRSRGPVALVPPQRETTAGASGSPDASAAFQALQSLGLPGRPGMFMEHAGSPGETATVWPQGQAIAAALDMAKVTGDYGPANSMMGALGSYAQGGAYSPSSPPGGDKFYDDNAWLGLDFMQAYGQTKNAGYLDQAKQTFDFLQKGLSPDGGLMWKENGDTRNACSNAPAMELAARLYNQTRDPKYLDFAKNCEAFVEGNLRSPEGLYYDHKNADGTVEKSIWSYNQGAMIGADVQMYQATGDRAYLDRATQTANAALTQLPQNDGLWKQPPSFNAIFFRNLLALDQAAPNPQYRQAAQAYLDRAWTQGRNPSTGYFDQGGIGSYGHKPGVDMLDQAGMAQLAALLSWPAQELANVA